MLLTPNKNLMDTHRINEEKEARTVKLFMFPLIFAKCRLRRCQSWSLLLSPLLPGHVHGSSAPSGSGCVPPLRISWLAHDASLWHPAQTVWSGRHRSSRGPASGALAAVRPSDLLHQQSVSHAGLLWNHWPAGGLHSLDSSSCWCSLVFLKVWRGKNKIWVLEKVKQIMYSCYTSILSPLLILPCYSVLLYCFFFFFFCRVSSARMILRRSKFKYSSWSTAHAPPKTRVELTSSCLMEKQRCFLSSCFLDFYLPVRSLW